jgi:hypothetical protein
VDNDLWRFVAADAADAAREVVHHDPDLPWERIPVPADADAASASLVALAAEFQKLPPSIRGALGRATGNAAQLSDDRLQGLAELLQNADDEGADIAYFLVDDDRLLFGHNGSDFTLPDVWGLTIPWLSEKASQAEKLGRFGIGLKTLQTLSEAEQAKVCVDCVRRSLPTWGDHGIRSGRLAPVVERCRTPLPEFSPLGDPLGRARGSCDTRMRLGGR